MPLTKDNSPIMETCMSSSLWLPTPQSETAKTPPPPPPSPPQSQSPVQKRLQKLVEGARERWTYAIFWESSHNSSGATVLLWGDGYYQGEKDKGEAKTTPSPSSWLAEEQAHCKKVLLEHNSLIWGPEVSTDVVDEEVTDTVWFFHLSMFQIILHHDTSLPGLAFSNSTPVWVTGPDRLSQLGCYRAHKGQVYGLRTLVCIPVRNGVVELASTHLIFENPRLVNRVVGLFNAPAFHVLPRFPFDPSQWEELQHQALNFMNIMSVAWSHVHIGLDRKIDHEQIGSCRRLDGKKLRCSKESYQDSKNDEMSHETAENEMQNRGKEKISDSKCSWPSLTESFDSSTDTTSSYSADYSGPS